MLLIVVVKTVVLMVVEEFVEIVPAEGLVIVGFVNIKNVGRQTSLHIHMVVTGMMETRLMSVALILNVLGFAVMENASVPILILQ